MPPVNKKNYILKILREADKPLSAKQIGDRFPTNWRSSGLTVGTMLSHLRKEYDDILCVKRTVGHGHTRFYYLGSNPNIRVEDF